MVESDSTLDEREQLILSELGKHPEGLGFNELHDKLKNRMADKTLNKRIGNLQDEGLVEKTPINPRKGEKVTYRLPGGVNELTQIKQHITSIADKESRKFINIIEQWEAGDLAEDGLFPLLNEQYMIVVTRTFLVAYTDSFDYGKRTRRHILLHAFEACENAHANGIEYLEKKQSELESPTVLSKVIESFKSCQLYPIPEHPDHSDTKIVDNFILLGTDNLEEE